MENFSVIKLLTLLSTFIIAFAISMAYVSNTLAEEIHVHHGESIQSAINRASDGDIVIVHEGDYIENIDFSGKAITLRSISRDDRTRGSSIIIGSNLKKSVITFGNGEKVNSVLDGFIITKGSASKGGGIYCHSSSPAIINCTIIENSAKWGGGIYCDGSSPIITNCVISKNTARAGGGIRCRSCSPAIINCTITKNSADTGSGISCWYSSPIITNSILWNNLPEEIDTDSGTPVITCSDIRGGLRGQDNINKDPLFIDPNRGDYHLDANSPCIDVGSDCKVFIDADGHSRFKGKWYDMGAYEFITKEIHAYPGGKKIQETIDAASDGDTIVLHEGIYKENIDFLGKAVTVRSLAPYDSNVVAATVIDGGGAKSAVTFDGKEKNTSVLSGITLKNGKSTLGGGIYCHSSSPTVSNCVITGNLALSYGGGIYSVDSSPAITDCRLIENSAQEGGGGCYFRSSSPAVTNCIITGNSVLSHGGGVYSIDSSPVITNCTIRANKAFRNSAPYGDGGGIYCSSSALTLANCNIYKNSASDDGGGIVCTDDSTANIAHCTIAANSASYGGGMSLWTKSSIEMVNCTVANNSAYSKGGAIYCFGLSSPVITNCILWNDSPHEIYVYNDDAIKIKDSNIQGGYEGTGNISIDPAFIDPNGGDYRLRPGSPCLDKGANNIND